MEYNLDDKINLLYDFMYNQNTKNCFTTNKIILGKIGLDDIKISIPDESDIEYYDLIKKNILSGQFKIILFDNDIYLKKYSNQFPITIKISFYDINDNINDLFKSPINNDSLFSYILSELVISKKTKHIILPLMNIDIKIDELEKIISDNVYYDKIKNLIKNNNIHDICCLHIREHFFKSINLSEYLLKNKCIFKGLLFQVIHTLAVLQKEFNGFKHNNLILKNIFIYLKNNEEIYSEYDGFKKDIFYLPNIGIDIKISNFEKAIIPKYYEIDKNIPNQYYDLYTFMKELLEFNTLNKCDSTTIDFFDKYLPLEIRKKYNNKVIITPFELLYDKYFDEYRIKPSKIGKSFSNYQYLTTKSKIIDTFMNSDNHSILGSQNKISRTIIMNKRFIKQEYKYIRIKRMPAILLGGYDKPPNTNEKNTPFISNDEKETFKKKKAETHVKESNLILDQKVYGVSKPDKKEYPTPYIPLYDANTGEVTTQMMPYSMLPYSNIIGQKPVQQKIYNISLANPIGNHTTINQIYEDMLPGQPEVLSALTIYERRQLTNFIKTTIINNRDGENMNITGGNKSLLSFIKVVDCNPYAFKKNPYHDLAKDFLLYRAAYPIRYSEKHSIEIAKQSMGMNVRLYKMSLGAMRCENLDTQITKDTFDLWRELKYYDWVRDDVIKNKLSPNFISPYLYKIDTESRIDWDRLELIKKEVEPIEDRHKLILNQQIVNKYHSIKKTLGQLFLSLPKNLSPNIELTNKEKFDKKKLEIENEYLNKIQEINNNLIGDDRHTQIKITETNFISAKNALNKEFKGMDDVYDITANSGKVLILLTEAPTSSFLQWCAPIYEKVGTVRKMVSTGFHTLQVWKSIFFQLIYAFAVLQKKNIFIDNFFLENIFIKDISMDYNSIGSWIYKVGSIDYYIPNYGYILMIDSKFADIDINYIDPDKQQFKIYCNTLYNDNVRMSDNDIKTKMLEQFKKILNPDNFRHSLNIDGGGRPPDEIITLFNDMYNNTNQDMKDYIIEYFKEFVHNKVGTPLLISEKLNINKLSRSILTPGKLMVYERRYDEFEWVIYIGPNTAYQVNILTKLAGSSLISEKSIYTGSLFGYPPGEKINQDINSFTKYDGNNIYETYSID